MRGAATYKPLLTLSPRRPLKSPTVRGVLVKHMKTYTTPTSKQAHGVAPENDRTAAIPALGPDEFTSDLDYLNSTKFRFTPFFQPRDIPGYEVFALVEDHAESTASTRISLDDVHELFHGQFCPDAHVPVMRGVFGINATIVGDELVLGPRRLQVIDWRPPDLIRAESRFLTNLHLWRDIAFHAGLLVTCDRARHGECVKAIKPLLTGEDRQDAEQAVRVRTASARVLRAATQFARKVQRMKWEVLTEFDWIIDRRLKHAL